MLTRWGLLPLGLPLAWLLATRIGAAVFPGGSLHKRVLTGATLTLALVVMVVRLFGAFGWLDPTALMAALVVLTGAAIWIGRANTKGTFRLRTFVSRETALPLIGVLAAIAVVSASAYFLPVWQWDAIGYHLPFVNFALERGRLADVPSDVPYLATYPHVVEYAFIAWRALLPDDRLVDLAQLPFGFLGAAAIAGIARRKGARADHAICGGLLWLTLPAVFLQLPTNYVDVASASLLLTCAYFLLGELGTREIAVTSIALGLFLGSKPNAPIGTTLLFAVLAVRVLRDPNLSRGHATRLLAGAGLCAFVIGAESFVENVVRHGNPIWPVRLGLGPIHLPGTLPMSALLESGAGAPRVHGNVLVRIAKSWPALFSQPAFDMRIGGLGVIFLCALPVAIWESVRKRDVFAALIAVAALASPDPAVARYILAFPGLVLALAMPRIETMGPKMRTGLFALAAGGVALNLVVATPGLAGEGPPISAYFSMSEDERARAVGADGPPTHFLDALERLRPGELTAFDASFDLPYLAWPSDLSTHARRIEDGTNVESARRILEDPRIRLFIVGDDLVTGQIVRTLSPSTFAPLFHCKSSSCTVYIRN